MTYGVFFWILVLFTILFDFWPRPSPPATSSGYRPRIGNWLVFILIILLGLGTYGPALHR